MMCAKVEPVVDELRKEFGDRMNFVVEPYDTTKGKAAIEKHGLDVHGMIITNQKDELYWIESGHFQTLEKVREEVVAALGG